MSCLRKTGEVVDGCHMVVEAFVNGNWAVFDPMYDISFRKPIGGLASFSEVSNDWEFYREQVPADYPRDWFGYYGVRYTNWEKIPGVLPAVREGLRWVWLGDEVDSISLRMWVLDIYRILAALCIVSCMLIFLLLLRIYVGFLSFFIQKAHLEK